MKAIIQQYRNARAIIKQMKRGEWLFTAEWERIEFYDEFGPLPTFNGWFCKYATRNGIVLVVGEGAFRCDIKNKPWELGIFRLLVWFCGARQGRRKSELSKTEKREPSNLFGGSS